MTHYFFLKHFSGPESGILEFDWLLTRVPPVQFFPIRTGFVMDHWMKVEKQHTSVELENFFIYGSKMRLFWQVTILVCVVNGKFNKEGNKRPWNTFKRQVLVLILCSLAWRLVSLLLNSLNTAVLVFKLRSPQCLLTPIFTLMTSFFSFFS